jgi:hypothetical protein
MVREGDMLKKLFILLVSLFLISPVWVEAGTNPYVAGSGAGIGLCSGCQSSPTADIMCEDADGGQTYSGTPSPSINTLRCDDTVWTYYEDYGGSDISPESHVGTFSCINKGSNAMEWDNFVSAGGGEQTEYRQDTMTGNQDNIYYEYYFRILSTTANVADYTHPFQGFDSTNVTYIGEHRLTWDGTDYTMTYLYRDLGEGSNNDWILDVDEDEWYRVVGWIKWNDSVYAQVASDGSHASGAEGGAVYSTDVTDDATRDVDQIRMFPEDSEISAGEGTGFVVQIDNMRVGTTAPFEQPCPGWTGTACPFVGLVPYVFNWDGEMGTRTNAEDYACAYSGGGAYAATTSGTGDIGTSYAIDGNYGAFTTADNDNVYWSLPGGNDLGDVSSGGTIEFLVEVPDSNDPTSIALLTLYEDANNYIAFYTDANGYLTVDFTNQSNADISGGVAALDVTANNIQKICYTYTTNTQKLAVLDPSTACSGNWEDTETDSLGDTAALDFATVYIAEDGSVNPNNTSANDIYYDNLRIRVGYEG